MLYKITNNLIAVDPKLYLTPQPSSIETRECVIVLVYARFFQNVVLIFECHFLSLLAFAN
jgi:hypothetical protein